MRFTPWFELLVQNRFRVHPLRAGLALTVTTCTVMNSIMAAQQRIKYGRQIAATAINTPPLFIIGHWRSGTTFLHELMALDPQFTYPTTYECFAPEHFLISRSFLPAVVRWLLPRRRPMDDVAMGVERPQEDEIALCSMGAPSPMLRMAFPNHPPVHLDTLDLQETSVEKRVAWQKALLGFLKTLTWSRPSKRLLLKSPPHTGRIGYLARMFPGAQFIHLTRDPCALYGSTMRLWQTLDYDHGLQIPHHRGLENFVFEACRRMYQGYLRDRHTIPQENLYELSYESLIADPFRQLRRIYEALRLNGFSQVEAAVAAYLSKQRDYHAAQYQFDAEVKRQISRQWEFYYDAFGYSTYAARGSGLPLS